LLQFGNKCKRSATKRQNYQGCLLPIYALFLHKSSQNGENWHIMSTDFGLRLKNIREEKGLKREDVATKIGTSQAIIGRYERGERTPSIDIAKNIAEALEVSLDYLAGDTSVLLKDKKMLYRLEVLEKVSPTYKDRILYMLDVMLKDAQNNSLNEKLA
jgi:transcriptional regulator with XRE-family HTH domain